MFKKIFGIFLLVTSYTLLVTNCFAQESLTITTYYPSPYGVYNQLQTRTFGVGDADGDGTFDANDVPDPATNPGEVWIAGNVGIGTGTAAVNGRLGVNGEINFVPQAAAPVGNQGDLYYDLGTNGFRYHDDTGWMAFGGVPEYYYIEDASIVAAGAVRVRVWQRIINVQGGDYLLNVVANVGGTAVGDYWFGVDTTDLGYGRIRFGFSEATANQQFNVTRIVSLSSGSHTLYFDVTSEQSGDTSYIWGKYITLIRVQ